MQRRQNTEGNAVLVYSDEQQVTEEVDEIVDELTVAELIHYRQPTEEVVERIERMAGFE